MKVAIMQPYIFPYIGYFQLINAVDDFVFFDDVNFIKKGWINRNSVLLNDKPHLFTIPCINASQNKLIKDTVISSDLKGLNKLLKTIKIQYAKAPYFDEVFQIIEEVFLSIKKDTTISELSIKSVLDVCKYLGIERKFSLSSDVHEDSIALKNEKRILHICKKKNANVYINPIGGTALYDKESFKDQNVQLEFINSLDIKYKQFDNEFVPNLSIIDVIMFNSIEESIALLNQYELV